MDIEPIFRGVYNFKKKVKQENDGVIIELPSNLSPSHKSTIWDTTKLSYNVEFQLKMMKMKEPLQLTFPITIIQTIPKVYLTILSLHVFKG